jgi:D-serine deaminase-like pyridoxal phosphate-dependent protein
MGGSQFPDKAMLNAMPYEIREDAGLLTPALAIYPAYVDANVANTIRLLGGDPKRWRPHVKTAKLAFVMKRLVEAGVMACKASTTLELATACAAGFEDVLLAYPVVGANARRVVEIAAANPGVALSTLVENAAQAAQWKDTPLGLFIDLNTGMNRTGIEQEHIGEVVNLARQAGSKFRGLHYYDGHLHQPDLGERRERAHAGYDRLMRLVSALESARVSVPELITSGTPAFPYAIDYPGFVGLNHKVSPGTVVYNDMTSLSDLPDFGYAPAALVIATVVSHPKPNRLTCDAGHKSVSADAGVPTCVVLGRPDLMPDKPSEEHLPMDCAGAVPGIGKRLYLLPRHVCPTVNNFDEALIVEDGRISGVERVSARGHESPYALAGAQTSA